MQEYLSKWKALVGYSSRVPKEQDQTTKPPAPICLTKPTGPNLTPQEKDDNTDPTYPNKPTPAKDHKKPEEPHQPPEDAAPLTKPKPTPPPKDDALTTKPKPTPTTPKPKLPSPKPQRNKKEENKENKNEKTNKENEQPVTQDPEAPDDLKSTTARPSDILENFAETYGVDTEKEDSEAEPEEDENSCTDGEKDTDEEEEKTGWETVKNNKQKKPPTIEKEAKKEPNKNTENTKKRSGSPLSNNAKTTGSGKKKAVFAEKIKSQFLTELKKLKLEATTAGTSTVKKEKIKKNINILTEKYELLMFNNEAGHDPTAEEHWDNMTKEAEATKNALKPRK